MIKSAEYTKVEPAEYKFTVSIDIIPSAKSLPLWPQDIIDIMETCLENVKQGRGFEGWPRDYCDMKRVIRFCTKEDILGFLELFREHTVKKTSPGPSYLIYHKNDIIQSIPERFLEDEDFSSKVDQYRGWNK